MGPELFVILEPLNDCIQDVFANSQFSFQQRYELFTVIGKCPDAILYTDKPDFGHNPTESITDWPAALRHIKNNDSPAFIPATRLILKL